MNDRRNIVVRLANSSDHSNSRVTSNMASGTRQSTTMVRILTASVFVCFLCLSTDRSADAQSPRQAVRGADQRADVSSRGTLPSNQPSLAGPSESKQYVRFVDHGEFVQEMPAGTPSEVQSLPSPTVVYEMPQMAPGCNTLGPMSPCPVRGFHCLGCSRCNGREKQSWKNAGPIPWQAFAQGEYIGPARLAHVPEYRLRVDDLIDFVFRLTREPSNSAYVLDVGDVVRIQSALQTDVSPTSTDAEDAEVQPDGTVSLRLLNQVKAAGLTIDELRLSLNRLYVERGYVQADPGPQITVYPVQINARLEELRAAVDNRYGRGGQAVAARITPEGTIQLPAIGSVPAQGLNLDELRREILIRYDRVVKGMDVTPILQQRAPRYVYVLGEVATPGRFELVAPTTVMQSIALAGGWNIGGNMNHIVVFRRDQNWNLMATRLEVFNAVLGKQPCPADEIWLRDSDIVLVPKRSILLADDFIEMVFTRGLYGVVPINATLNYSRFSNAAGVIR